jgi:DnaJ-class molecular chaperone
MTRSKNKEVVSTRVETNFPPTFPFRCPICNGNGLVPGGFYNQTSGFSMSTNVSEQCRACNGTGIIYVKQEKQ